jgi:hypothetical protein
MSSVFRSRVNPPRPILKSSTKSPRNFLRQPSPLAMLDDDDEPIFSASKKGFASLDESIFSPSKKDSTTACLSPAPLSAHVHFPATPGMAATFAAHSPNTYDRAPISVAPNPCELPSRGDRVYNLEDIFSPNKAQFGFEKAKYPTDVTFHDSITSILESSESSDESDSYVYTKPKSGSVKFALHAPPSPIPRAQSKEEIEKALSFLPYPLSPYPRSSGKENNAKKTLSPEKGEVRREVKRANSLAVPSPQGRTVTPARPAQSKRVQRRPAELNLLEPPLMRPPGLGPTLSSVPESPRSAEMSLDVPSSVTGSGGESEGSSELSAAFWLAVTVEEASDDEGAGPTSPFVFGRKDGSLWSPGLPRKSRASSTDMMISRSIFSPAAETFGDNLASVTSPAPNDPIATFTSFTTALNVEKHFASITSPAPNDPVATFSSFSAALAYLGSDSVITFPPSVELKAERPFRR